HMSSVVDHGLSLAIRAFADLCEAWGERGEHGWRAGDHRSAPPWLPRQTRELLRRLVSELRGCIATAFTPSRERPARKFPDPSGICLVAPQSATHGNSRRERSWGRFGT